MIDTIEDLEKALSNFPPTVRIRGILDAGGNTYRPKIKLLVEDDCVVIVNEVVALEEEPKRCSN